MTKQRIDVFISSTSLDLPEYRRAVSEAILMLGLFPSGMEHWAVGDENAVQLCRRKIDDAEIYLGIYAYRYGWRPHGYGDKSITELEYDWATERGIPRLRFIMADSHPWPESEKEKDDQEALGAFKTRLKQEVVGFFTTPDDLKAQVIAALAGYAAGANAATLTPYLRALHHASLQSGLLRALDPRTNDPSYGGRAVTVDQVYVPLHLQQLVRRDDDGTILSGVLGHEGAPDAERDLSALTAMEAANGIDRLVLLGDPGSGKSTFVNFLTLAMTGAQLNPDADWAARLEDQGWAHGIVTPLLVTLRDFAQSVDVSRPPTVNTLWEYVVTQVVGLQAPDSASALRSLLEHGRLIFLLDGLDEVPQERRGTMREAIDMLASSSALGTRFIITCRVLSYADPQYRIPGFVSHTIAPLTNGQIAAFIGTWYSALVALGSIHADTAVQRVSDLRVAIAQLALSELASNPMLLTVMALVHNHLGTLPRETARLYNQCVELLLLRWRPHDARALIDLLGIREDDLLRLVWEVAFDAHDQQAEREGTADIAQHAVEMIARRFLGNDAAKGQAFCEYVEKRAGLLVGRGFDRYGGRIYTFPHRTFQEFLAGCHISVNRFSRTAADLARRGGAWRETLLLATGNLVFNGRNVDTPIDAVSRMLEDASPRAGDSDWRLYALAGEMLLLVGLDNLERDRYGTKALEDTRIGLAALLEAGALPVIERAAAGRTLSLLGDPRPGVGLRPDGLPDIDWVTIPDDGAWIFQDEQHLPLAPFSISRYPITFDQFQAFLDATDRDDARWWEGMPEEESAYGGVRRVREFSEQGFPFANYPRENVSWYQAVAFCRWLSAKIGLNITLPTEKQWEKAARGTDGRNYAYTGEFDATRGNTDETGLRQTSPVGLFPSGASPYGVLDVTGNVLEWCANKATDLETSAVDARGDARCLRGGSWGYRASFATTTYRVRYFPNYRLNDRGFRIVST
ncbi:MAG: SUMF1/EgtB/PvdO family nonheme iron enzyme [Chloroflexi bacterium]|nr:SUMF1/EgtB/PvdO family nonheme iron enzyme [Chloroflexota bacterium]